MEGRPVISFAGDRNILKRLESGIVSSLPTEPVEWKRSYGRTSKSVYVEVEFQPFNVEALVKGRRSLIGQQVLHTYWTDCTDVDTYKSSLKDDIQAWLSTLKKSGSSSDWLVVIVETPDSRKANKLLTRTTVLDKLKQDLAGKTPERCLSIIDPTKSDSKAAESMQSFLHKLRQFFLQSYNRTLNKFEELIRSEREKRNESGWNFCNYFLLQEQLAVIYSIMGLQDEALVQYDELDALFTQFVLNSSVGVTPPWLANLHSQLLDWTGFSLDKNINNRLRSKIEQCDLSLLELRNYLFSRQGNLLLQLNQEEQLARRCLAFLYNTLQEVCILELDCTQGSKEIWVALCSLEVLRVSKGINLHTAALWSFLRETLLSLGKLCGLMPGTSPSSSQLHLVVGLFGGLKEDLYLKLDNEKNPAERLKEALSSQSSFQKNYLEMAEIAISTYKHIGRIRSARLIGGELAEFYIAAGQVQQAAAFLIDSLKTFQFEGWQRLSVKTLLDLVNCYKLLGDGEKYLRTCVQISSCRGATSQERSHYFREMSCKLAELPNTEIITSGEGIVFFKACNQIKDRTDEKTVPGVQIKFSLEIESNLPNEVLCERLKISLAVSELQEEKKPASTEERRPGRKGVHRSPSVASSNISVFSMGDEEDDCDEVWRDTGRPQLLEKLEYKQDKSLCAARIVCRNATKLLKRKDSSGTILKDGQLKPADYTHSLQIDNVLIEPGINKYEMEGLAGKKGVYTLNQMSLHMKQLNLLQNIPLPTPAFTVTTEEPVIILNKGEGELYAGIENKLSLSIFSGSESVEPGTEVELTCSRGVGLRDPTFQEQFARSLKLTFPGGESFQTLSLSLLVRSELENKKDSSTIEVVITVSNPWTGVSKDITLHFVPVIYSTFNLLTAMSKKFLQITVFSPCARNFVLTDGALEVVNHDQFSNLLVTPINQKYPEVVISKQFEGSFLWELGVGEGEKDPPAKVRFSVSYAPEDGTEAARGFSAVYQFQDYRTLFTINAKVEPAKGNEFCRASTLCPMRIEVEQLNPAPHSSLFYEVLADQTQWAVCGRQGAVINLQQSLRQNIIVDVMPLTGGLLPLPTVRLSKYIPAEGRSGGLGGARLDPFSAGQVYNMSRAQQVHVLPPQHVHGIPPNQTHEFVSLP